MIGVIYEVAIAIIFGKWSDKSKGEERAEELRKYLEKKFDYQDNSKDSKSDQANTTHEKGSS
jgi:alcohol dehydrogenase YqhD (iron-dependent ADH family)